MVRFSTHSLWKAVLFLGLLIVGCSHAESTCKSRRCLAEILVNKKFASQPQYEDCSQMIMVPFIEYQTLSVKWEDPELAWDTSVYPYDQVVLPVSKVWTPELRVTNGITTTMRHSSHDLLVMSNGTVKHNVIITAEVNCEVNLFNYPFAWDACPVAIQTWSDDGCGTRLEFDKLKMVDGTHGDWQTDDVFLARQTDERNYILVQLSIKYTNPFITLMLPSILIVLADVVSFALPLGGGERNSFKVTLVLSFTMFLIILNDQLPGDSACSPVIRTHFCICLVLLVVSMLASMVMTRLAKDGSLILCCCSPVQRKKKDDEEDKADISVVQVDGTVEHTRMLRKVVNFLENLDAQTLESERHQMFANKLDKAFFWLYFISAILYFSAMSYVMVNYKCTVNHFDFWY
ncbi:hypothetical protein ABVT39_027398 [Epinephelus coioides]